MAIYSCILSWKIPWTEEPGVPQSMGHKESETIETHTHTHTHTTFEERSAIQVSENINGSKVSDILRGCYNFNRLIDPLRWMRPKPRNDAQHS